MELKEKEKEYNIDCQLNLLFHELVMAVKVKELLKYW